MALLRQASHEYNYDIDPREVAKIWRAGCIIRAALLRTSAPPSAATRRSVNLMLDEHFSALAPPDSRLARRRADGGVGGDSRAGA